jgi:hypothetical protein
MISGRRLKPLRQSEASMVRSVTHLVETEKTRLFDALLFGMFRRLHGVLNQSTKIFRKIQKGGSYRLAIGAK